METNGIPSLECAAIPVTGRAHRHLGYCLCSTEVSLSQTMGIRGKINDLLNDNLHTRQVMLPDEYTPKSNSYFEDKLSHFWCFSFACSHVNYLATALLRGSASLRDKKDVQSKLN